MDRQRTLDGVIESSWRLLEPQEQAVLARLAVFPGTFAPDAAEVVAAAPAGGPRDAGPLVAALADKSLLQVDASALAPIRMLQPVREFCRARLSPGRGRLSAARRTARTTCALVEHAAPMLDSDRSSGWLGDSR